VIAIRAFDMRPLGGARFCGCTSFADHEDVDDAAPGQHRHERRDMASDRCRAGVRSNMAASPPPAAG
jgi:hypothetical protein